MSSSRMALRSFSVIFCGTATCISMLSHSVMPIAYRFDRTTDPATLPCNKRSNMYIKYRLPVMEWSNSSFRSGYGSIHPDSESPKQYSDDRV